MRVLLPVGIVVVFVVVVKLAWAEVHEAITKSTENSPYRHAPPAPATRQPHAEPEPVEDDRVFEPNAALPPPARPRGRTQYADPHTPPPNRVHPAERVMNTP